MVTQRRDANRRYYERTRDRIILRESELRPSTIVELIDCLREQELDPADHRIDRLIQLYHDLTGQDPDRQR